MTIKRIDVKYFDVPTETMESDGTLSWTSTGLVTVELESGDHHALGYTYGDLSTAAFIVEHGVPFLMDQDEKEHHLIVSSIKKQVRNLGHGSISSLGISAIDTALWDLRARVLGVSIQDLIGVKRRSIPFYGSGIFINNSEEEIGHQIEKFYSYGIKTFKMKLGEGINKDAEKVKLVKSLLPPDSELYVDANAFYSPREALALARILNELDISYFEEPINSHDIQGMLFLKERFPEKVNLVAGEYCYLVDDVMNLLRNGVVDILQVDATRCEGVTGSIMAGHLAKAFHVPVSSHCAPLLHGNIGVCMENFRIGELFYDHLLIEEQYFYFDGKYADGFFEPSKKQKGFGWKLNPEHKEHLAYEHVAA